MTVREVLKLLKKDGWSQVATKGSHRQFKHPAKPGRVPVAGKLSKTIPPKTLNSIPRQAGLKEDDS
jgi:predicted RNA binding protein YcfA (HicA-like mRNA interferase family)